MASRDKKPAKPSSSRTGGIRTLSDLNRPSARDSDSDDEPQEYYTGGEKSGMLVQDPSKGNDVNAIFNQARKLGAIEEPVEDVNSSSSSRSFTGTGRLLSEEAAPFAPPPPQQPESNVHNIVFWRNGFTVNDGPLRRLDDPANAPFLESIRKSESPKELEPADKRSSVVVKLIKRDEDCPEPEKHQVSFQGVGRTLGSGGGCPIMSTSESLGSGGRCPIMSTSESTVAVAVASNSLERILDENLPTTSIQLRLGDGTRVVGQFNYHNTVGEIRAFIDSSRPGGSRSYQLQTGFPPKQLTDPTQTIEQAGLANSVVVQKF